LKRNIFLLFGLTFVLSFATSCKSKKSLAQQNVDLEKGIPADFVQVRFGYLYVNACSERAKGNLQEALKLFEECKNLESDNPAVRYELATIYKLLGNGEEALSNAKICADADPKNEWYQLLLVEVYNDNKMYGAAVKVRETLVKNFPEKNEFKEDLAIQYAIMGQYDKAFRIYDQLEKSFGVNEQITLNKVKLLRSQKKNREAEAEFLKLSATEKKEPRYYAYLAEFYLDMGELEKAKKMYDKILEVEPQNPTVNLALHDYYSNKNQQDEAYTHLKRAFYNPDLDVATKASIVGDFYLRAEQNSQQAKKQGMELTEIMLKLHPKDTEPNALYGDFLRLDKKLEEASNYYYKAAVSERRDYRVWDNLLFVDNELNRFDSLDRHSSMAIEYFPSQPVNYLYNGVANSQLKNYAKAILSLKDGLEFVIDNKALKIQFLSALGDAYFYMRNYDLSDAAFDEALKIDSDNTYVLNNYAYYLSLRNQNLSKAEKYSKRTNELQPNNRNYMDTYGWILYQQKKFKEAEEWLSGAAKLGPKNPTILEHYGDVLFKLGKIEDARKYWQDALNAGGDSEALLKKVKEKKLDE